MFFLRTRAAKAAIKSLRGDLAMLEMAGGVPIGFWENPYALGWIRGVTFAITSLLNGGQPSRDDFLIILTNVLIAIVPKDKEVRGVIKTARTYSENNDQTLAKGSDNAVKVILFSNKRKVDEADEDIINALAFAKKMINEGLGDEHELAVGQLSNNLFLRVFCEDTLSGRDESSTNIAPEQIAEARKLAREWKPK